MRSKILEDPDVHCATFFKKAFPAWPSGTYKVAQCTRRSSGWPGVLPSSGLSHDVGIHQPKGAGTDVPRECISAWVKVRTVYTYYCVDKCCSWIFRSVRHAPTAIQVQNYSSFIDCLTPHRVGFPTSRSRTLSISPLAHRLPPTRNDRRATRLTALRPTSARPGP
ncbi:hypothetical protein VTK56DRAFT_10035 [Thermocarpiscus australiensis]